MNILPVQTEFNEIKKAYDEIYLIVSPPRCSSTAFARVFWEQPSIRYYSHEPFEGLYFMDKDIQYVIENLRHPLDLRRIKKSSAKGAGRSLVIKEMPYQVGDYFPNIITLTNKPVVFLTRDPRQNIASRMAKKIEAGDNPIFPLVETGWELIAQYIKHCQDHGVPYMIVEAKDFRNRPAATFKRVFHHLQLPFDESMLTWHPSPQVDIDNLGGQHSHLYQQVLSSTGMLADNDPIPPVSSFTLEGGFRDHVRKCLLIYDRLLNSSARIRPSSLKPETVFRSAAFTGD
jgi:hypothetical protein